VTVRSPYSRWPLPATRWLIDVVVVMPVLPWGR
jgi:hypothetical protein